MPVQSEYRAYLEAYAKGWVGEESSSEHLEARALARCDSNKGSEPATFAKFVGRLDAMRKGMGEDEMAGE